MDLREKQLVVKAIKNYPANINPKRWGHSAMEIGGDISTYSKKVLEDCGWPSIQLALDKVSKTDCIDKNVPHKVQLISTECILEIEKYIYPENRNYCNSLRDDPKQVADDMEYKML